MSWCCFLNPWWIPTTITIITNLFPRTAITSIAPQTKSWSIGSMGSVHEMGGLSSEEDFCMIRGWVARFLWWAHEFHVFFLCVFFFAHAHVWQNIPMSNLPTFVKFEGEFSTLGDEVYMRVPLLKTVTLVDFGFPRTIWCFSMIFPPLKLYMFLVVFYIRLVLKIIPLCAETASGLL